MTDLPYEFPNFKEVNPDNPEEAIRHLVELLEEFKIRVVEAVNSKQDSP